jgi:HD-like signal output (HDOD) protein
MIRKFFKKFAEKPVMAATQTYAGITLPPVFLQKLIPIGELPAKELQGLNITLRHFGPGEIVFNRGEISHELIYLYEGELYLEAINGNGYTIGASTFKACYPISTGTEQSFTAIAKSPVKAIYLPLSILKRSSTAAFVNNPLINPKDVPPPLRDSDFFQGFCETFRKDQLVVPSLPDVALQLRKALKNEISVANAAKIINLDPVISSKLIQVVNSPIYRTHKAVTSSYDAVFRLGMQTTQNLVTSVSLHHLFRSRNKRLNARIKQTWNQSIQVASISCTLASLTRKINPDEAMLGGLVHKIGTLPIIAYAESLSDKQYTEQELHQTIALVQGLVGEFILQKWHFPRRMQQIPTLTSNWYHDASPTTLQLSDIVLLARFHSELSGSQIQNLPPINTLPAFQKLGENALSPEMSLQTLADAKQQIAETLNFFRN